MGFVFTLRARETYRGTGTQAPAPGLAVKKIRGSVDSISCNEIFVKICSANIYINKLTRYKDLCTFYSQTCIKRDPR